MLNQQQMLAIADWLDRASGVVVLSSNGQVSTRMSSSQVALIVAALCFSAAHQPKKED